MRNLDCLRVEPDRAEPWGVLLVVEEGTPAHQLVRRFDHDFESARRAVPHLSGAAAAELWSHYLGFTTWQDIQRTFDLPQVHRDEPTIMTAGEIQALAGSIEAGSEAIVLLGGFGGLRFGEIADLQIGDCDPAAANSNHPTDSLRCPRERDHRASKDS